MGWLVRAGVAKWVADRPEHTSDSPRVCGESHLESHLFSSRVASIQDSLEDRGTSHGNEQTWALDSPTATTESGRWRSGCPDGSHWATSRTSGVDVDVPGRSCVSDDSNLAVRCCADAVVGTPCAMPPYSFPLTHNSPPSPVPIATPVVTTTEASIEGHVTLLLSLQLSDEAQNVYALHGGTAAGSPLYFPPAYQVAAPFGVNV